LATPDQSNAEFLNGTFVELDGFSRAVALSFAGGGAPEGAPAAPMASAPMLY
jgi:hypothetical protein